MAAKSIGKYASHGRVKDSHVREAHAELVATPGCAPEPLQLVQCRFRLAARIRVRELLEDCGLLVCSAGPARLQNQEQDVLDFVLEALHASFRQLLLQVLRQRRDQARLDPSFQ
eukprot:5279815-Pyramimonas_sp.AAC.1